MAPVLPGECTRKPGDHGDVGAQEGLSGRATMDYLPQLTFFINYGAFIIVLWLGLYLVMHNPRYLLSWLTALTLWSLATLFVHFLLEPTFWLSAGFELNYNRWFQGFAV